MGRLSLVSILLVMVIASKTSMAQNDRYYCGHTHRTKKLYPNYIVGTFLPTNIRGKDQASDLIVMDSGAFKIYKMVSGYLSGGVEIIPSSNTFCLTGGGVLHSADVNGDYLDDVVCVDSSGNVSFRLYTSNDYQPSQSLTTGFNCPTADSFSIGDFDGNGAKDFLCMNAAKTSYKIHFNAACTYSSRSRFHTANFNPFQARSHLGLSHNHGFDGDNRMLFCDGSLPAMRVLSGSLPCSTAGDNMYIGDVNGDRRDDVICHLASNGVSFVLSSGAVSSKIFGSTSIVSSAGTAGCFSSTDILYPADVDGDGDDDLVCMGDQASLTFHPIPISYTSGHDYAPFNLFPNAQCYPFCGHNNLRPNPMYVADFNGDGYDDLLCRISLWRADTTEISFSVSTIIN